MIDFTEIPTDGEQWELFARDFLEHLGFYIEATPDRGPDGKKDMLVTEHLGGLLNRYEFRWLVSCKHNAHSGNSVNESAEPNILDRLKSFRADGFIGFYSTLPSSGLGTRLSQLRNEKEIKDYRIFDHRLIENHLVSLGFSGLLMRFFPESHKAIRPVHKIFSDYVPIKCDHCGKDLLDALYAEQYQGVVAYATKHESSQEHVLDIYFACKGECDKKLAASAFSEHGIATAWKDISDLASPIWYLRDIMSTINKLHDREQCFDPDAFNKLKLMYMALAQKIMRETTQNEKERAGRLIDLQEAWGG